MSSALKRVVWYRELRSGKFKRTGRSHFAHFQIKTKGGEDAVTACGVKPGIFVKESAVVPMCKRCKKATRS